VTFFGQVSVTPSLRKQRALGHSAMIPVPWGAGANHDVCNAPVAKHVVVNGSFSSNLGHVPAGLFHLPSAQQQALLFTLTHTHAAIAVADNGQNGKT
jgi:hypothetical protein